MASNIFNNEKKSSYVWVNLLIHLSVILLIVLPEFITDLDNDRPVPVGVIIKTGFPRELRRTRCQDGTQRGRQAQDFCKGRTCL